MAAGTTAPVTTAPAASDSGTGDAQVAARLRRLSLLAAHPLAERLHALGKLARLLERLGLRIRLGMPHRRRRLGDLLVEIVEVVLVVAIDRGDIGRLRSLPQQLLLRSASMRP